jgi:hypothetical protein
MALLLPSRLLSLIDGTFKVVDLDPRRNPHPPHVDHFDIISYTWSAPTPPYKCEIEGVDWDMTNGRNKIEQIKRLMRKNGVLQFM